MKVSTQPVTGGSYTLLADESSRTQTLELFQPGFTHSLQVEDIVRGASPFTAKRNNNRVEIQIVATYTYATQALALASVSTFAALVSALNLKVEEGTTVHYYPNAIANGYQPQITGVTVRHSLKFISQQVTATAP